MAIRQVKTGQRAAYGAGTAIVAIKNILFHFFFIYFYSNVLGVGEGWIIAATTLAIFFDAISDPLMGQITDNYRCLLYTSPSPRDGLLSRMPSSA